MTPFLMIAIASLLATSLANAQTADDKAVVRLDPALDALVSRRRQGRARQGRLRLHRRPGVGAEGQRAAISCSPTFRATWSGSSRRRTARRRSISAMSATHGPEVWRWGGIQNNGLDRTDPQFEEFAMIGADGLTARPPGPADPRHLRGPLADAHREATASAPCWPTTTRASASAAPTTSWSSATARSISPTPIGVLPAAREGSAQGARLQRRLHVEGRQAHAAGQGHAR